MFGMFIVCTYMIKFYGLSTTPKIDQSRGQVLKKRKLFIELMEKIKIFLECIWEILEASLKPGRLHALRKITWKTLPVSY